MNSFLEALGGLITKLKDTQDGPIDEAAALGADAIAGEGWVHFFGSGHSVIPVHEAFPRYGSFVGLYPLTDPRLMWFNVLGPGGVRELLWMETYRRLYRQIPQPPAPRSWGCPGCVLAQRS